jgi:NADPH-dependent 2,4-dienoyl-CoA reductase/sulfur reductase-like enzyme
MMPIRIHYEKCWAHCDLLVIGSGPAGLAAALTAGRAGARVILLDEHPAAGGSLLSETADDRRAARTDFAATTVAELRSLDNVTILTRTTAFGWYDGNVFGAVERVQKHVSAPLGHLPVERLWRIIAKQALLATGAEERPLVFGGNDIPGVMMASAMRSYLNRYGVAPGKSVAIFTTNDSGYALAHDLVAAGVHLEAIIDSRPDAADPSRLARRGFSPARWSPTPMAARSFHRSALPKTDEPTHCRSMRWPWRAASVRSSISPAIAAPGRSGPTKDPASSHPKG